LLAATLACAPLTARADLIFVSVNNFTIETLDSGINNPPPTFFASTSGIGTPETLAFDSQGNLFAAIGGTTIEKYTSGGVGSVFATVQDGLSGIAFDSAGNLYAALAFDATIMKYTPQGVGSVFASGSDLRFDMAGLAFDHLGNPYVAMQGNGAIEQITPGGARSVFASVPGGALGLAFDSSGNLFVSVFQSGGGLIEKFTPGGAGSVFEPAVFLPGALAFDSSGNLLATDGFGLIERFSPDGNALAPLGPTAQEMLGMAVQPAAAAAPEPSTGVIVAVVVGVIGLARFGRRARRATIGL
jgi:hypothetical protein